MLLLHMQIRRYFNKICDNRIYRLPKGRGTDQWKRYCPSRTRTQWQSVYPDIGPHISNNCVYCIEDQHLTHTI